MTDEATGSGGVQGRLAVIGYPVEHSQSPRIHQQFARQFGGRVEYSKLPAKPEQFPALLKDFFDRGGRGANITLPLKEAACEICTQLDPYAEKAGAVNTVWYQREWHGANTDGRGLINDLTQNLGVSLQGRSVLILGAGGATRGILAPLLQQRPEEVVIANRTLNKAIDLADGFAGDARLRAVDLKRLAKPSSQPFDLIIQASSAGHQQQLPPLSKSLHHAHTFSYDLNYGEAAKPFLQRASASTAKHLVADGLGMLVEQAALSFELWFGKKPSTKEVISDLRNDSRLLRQQK